MKIMSRMAAACALFTLVLACSMADAQICAPSNSSGEVGIGDGCTTSYEGVDASWIMPDIGVYKSTFTPACNRHDKCYTTLGTTYNQCDSNLLADMRAACRDTFNPVLLLPIYTSCMSTAETYYGGVTAYESMKNPLPGFQRNALGRSNAMRDLQVATQPTSTCGTTPELTTLYDASLIAQINNQFQGSAHRLPTIYEFMDVIGTGNLVDDRASWNAWVVQAAANAAATVAPPKVSSTFATTATMATLTAASDQAGATYVWKVNGQTFNSAVAALHLKNPAYDTSWAIAGFVEVHNPSTLKRNMLVVNQMVYERGWCDAKDNHTTHCPRLDER